MPAAAKLAALDVALAALQLVEQAAWFGQAVRLADAAARLRCRLGRGDHLARESRRHGRTECLVIAVAGLVKEFVALRLAMSLRGRHAVLRLDRRAALGLLWGVEVKPRHIVALR